MGKKAKKGEKYVSKGIVGHPMKTRASVNERIMNQLDAWKKGKRVMLSIPRELGDAGSPRVEAKTVWGAPVSNSKVATVRDEVI